MFCYASSRKIATGMTLIEVVLSLVLAAMLMSAIIGVMRVVVLQTKYANSQAIERWPTQFIDLLYRDLLVAESVSSREGVIWIEGLAPSYSGNMIIEKRSVGYSCVPMESGHSGLLRIDGNHDGLIAIGPQSLVIERLDTDGQPQPLPSVPGPVPNRIRVWVQKDVSGTSIFVRDLVL